MNQFQNSSMCPYQVIQWWYICINPSLLSRPMHRNIGSSYMLINTHSLHQFHLLISNQNATTNMYYLHFREGSNMYSNVNIWNLSVEEAWTQFKIAWVISTERSDPNKAGECMKCVDPTHFMRWIKFLDCVENMVQVSALQRWQRTLGTWFPFGHNWLHYHKQLLL